MSLLEEIKIFVIEKNVSVTELITMNIRMRKHKKMMFPIMILQRWKVLMKIKDSIRNEHDKDSLNHGDEAIQHHKDSQTEINEDNTNEDIEDIEEQSQSDSKSDASESSKDESGKANKDVHEEKSYKKVL